MTTETTKRVHTPGPWAVGMFGRRIHVHGPEHNGESDIIANECSLEDAHLIAASPALLEACRAALIYITDECDDVEEAQHPLATQLKAAIALAGGKGE